MFVGATDNNKKSTDMTTDVSVYLPQIFHFIESLNQMHIELFALFTVQV